MDRELTKKELPHVVTEKEKIEIKRRIGEHVRKFAEKMQVTYRTVTLKNQKTRWGSCSSLGNLNFNYHIGYFPEEVMDYIIIHELAHRKYMNHSKDFWREVEKYCPEYKRYNAWLKKEGILILSKYEWV